ncbi:hypothetical protein LEMLEM_LOCUS15408 [Lemmus lemmus]
MGYGSWWVSPAGVKAVPAGIIQESTLRSLSTWTGSWRRHNTVVEAPWRTLEAALWWGCSSPHRFLQPLQECCGVCSWNDVSKYMD